MQQAVSVRPLTFFECDARSWAPDKPTDWNLVRRMRDAGVRIAATEQPVSRSYPVGGGRV